MQRTEPNVILNEPYLLSDFAKMLLHHKSEKNECLPSVGKLFIIYVLVPTKRSHQT